jgi:signal transduction histidine kinase
MLKKPKIKLPSSMAFKMVIYILVSIMVIFILIFRFTSKITSDIISKNLKSNAEYLTTRTVLKIEKVLSTLQRIPENYAEIIQQNEFNEDEINRLLRIMVENNREITGACIAFEPYYKSCSQRFYSLYYFRKDNKITFKNLGSDQYVYFYMDWYQIPKELEKSLWSEPYFDTGGADMVISTFSVPLYSVKDQQRKFIGILTIDLSLEWLQQYVNEIKVYESGYGFMISRTGSVITHPKKDLIMNETIFSIADEQKSPVLRKIGRSMINGESSFAEIEYRNINTGKLSWISYAPIPLNLWSLGIVFPVDEFMADVTRLRMIIIGLGIAGGVILILIIVLISRSITGPLRKLTKATEIVAMGKFDVGLPVIKSKDEIGRLNSAFHIMEDTIRRTINELKEAGENLRISHAKLEEYNRTLEDKVEERTATLKAAQTQLIQSEKMASLGQLTAGIAHEIKNPLNFVNNFSELSIELAGEVIEEIDKLSEALDLKDAEHLKGILQNIEANVKKINEHGKRADSIIRGMLLHSRGKSGEMQPTDLNALLAEYVALGYHGLRATDNTFNIKIETDYDTSIGLVNVVPQDISRVFLNLINNACYSTAQKKKELKDAYFPILKVSTEKLEKNIAIQIWDNGKGIPKSILDRIFNPFFTTKPAGSGTGLGLSISYDIVVQEHHGEIKVDSKEGEYTEFIINLPASS